MTRQIILFPLPFRCLAMENGVNSTEHLTTTDKGDTLTGPIGGIYKVLHSDGPVR
jgi:hypothetical protein